MPALYDTVISDGVKYIFVVLFKYADFVYFYSYLTKCI